MPTNATRRNVIQLFFIHLPYRSIYLSIYVSIYLHIYRSIDLSIYLLDMPT